MINLFIGDNEFLIKQKIIFWKNLFKEKYGELNLIHIKNTFDFEVKDIISNIITQGFLGEKKLIIIDNIPSSSKEKNSILEDEISKNLDKIPKSNIVIFNSINPDKRTKFFKEILKKTDKKEEFYFSGENEIFNLIEKKYKDKISKQAIEKIIKYKNKNFSKIILELEKLFITYDFVDEEVIEKNIVAELEESIFVFINNILDNNLKQVLKNFEIIVENTNIYQFYNGLLANLRNTIYIEKLKNLKIPNMEIISNLNLGNKSFLVNRKYNLSFKKLQKIYFDLIDLDLNNKTGNIIGTKEKDFIFEIQKIFIKNLVN